jgi:hypothetical protein
MQTKTIFNPLLLNRFQKVKMDTVINTGNILTVSKGGDDADALTAGKYDFTKH